MLLPETYDSDYEVEWPMKERKNWRASMEAAESVPLVVLDDGQDSSEYRTRILEPEESDNENDREQSQRLLPMLQSGIKRRISCATCAMTVLLTALGIVIGLVAWTSNQIKSVLPHTFAWRSLTVLYGFHQKENVDLSSKAESISVIVPAIQLGMLTALAILSACFVFFPGTRRQCSSGIKVFTFTQVILFVVGSPIVLILWYEISSGLRDEMVKGLERSMKMEPNNSSPILWNTTQSSLHCCGIDSFRDWMINGSFKTVPFSCQNTTVTKSKVPCNRTDPNSTCTWWNKGCFEHEAKTIDLFGGLEIAWFTAACIISILMHFFAKLLLKYSSRLEDLEVPLKQEVFMKMGDNFMCFNNRGYGRTEIQVKEMYVETKGALSSSLGVTENGVSMEVYNYCIFDKINVSREYDRIVVSVSTNDSIRGVATITTDTRNELERIRVKRDGALVRVLIG